MTYACIKLNEGGYIKANIKELSSGNILVSVSDITFIGHELLNVIRNNKIWEEAKTKAEENESASLSIVYHLAQTIALKNLS